MSPTGPISNADFGFMDYKADALKKVNAQRRALSLIQISDVPILDKGSVLFSSADANHHEPLSCYNCIFFNEGPGTCQFFGSSIRTVKLTFPPTPTPDAKPIEYWPVCGLQVYGEPAKGETYRTPLNPDDYGLSWINAPEVGQLRGGSNCGGSDGGDDCDHYIVPGDSDKRDYKTGFCRVLNTQVEAGACCTAWVDDDLLSWQKAQDILKKLGATKASNPLLKQIKKE